MAAPWQDLAAEAEMQGMQTLASRLPAVASSFIRVMVAPWAADLHSDKYATSTALAYLNRLANRSSLCVPARTGGAGRAQIWACPLRAERRTSTPHSTRPRALVPGELARGPLQRLEHWVVQLVPPQPPADERLGVLVCHRATHHNAGQRGLDPVPHLCHDQAPLQQPQQNRMTSQMMHRGRKKHINRRLACQTRVRVRSNPRSPATIGAATTCPGNREHEPGTAPA